MDFGPSSIQTYGGVSMKDDVRCMLYGGIDYKSWIKQNNKNNGTTNPATNNTTNPATNTTTNPTTNPVTNQTTNKTTTPVLEKTPDQDEFKKSGEKCTDGKDDGKIGFFAAVGNIIKGAGKAAVNGIKGMFTDKEGKFSLGKTLLSVGTAALCVAFPAAGLIACGIGAVAGGAKILGGIGNAIGAKTDAEAKEAWQSVGDGGLTVGLSVAGGKASLKGVKATSTSTKGLAYLGKDATLKEKAIALGHDMISSTKNRWEWLKGLIGRKTGAENINNPKSENKPESTELATVEPESNELAVAKQKAPSGSRKTKTNTSQITDESRLLEKNTDPLKIEDKTTAQTKSSGGKSKSSSTKNKSSKTNSSESANGSSKANSKNTADNVNGNGNIPTEADPKVISKLKTLEKEMYNAQDSATKLKFIRKISKLASDDSYPNGNPYHEYFANAVKELNKIRGKSVRRNRSNAA